MQDFKKNCLLALSPLFLILFLLQEYPFVLDPFQREAILCIDNNESVLVSAHTSAGKTVCAEWVLLIIYCDNFLLARGAQILLCEGEGPKMNQGCIKLHKHKHSYKVILKMNNTGKH